MKLLTFSTLYPNTNQTSHGIFVENRLLHLVAAGQATSTVVAPIVYVPDVSCMPDRYRSFCNVPRSEERNGLRVFHPRYFLLPKVSMSAAPFLLYLAARRCVSALLAAGYDFDLIDAHYFYPDGVAAVLLGRYFGKPVTVTARGSDINVLAQYRQPRRMIRWAAAEAAGVITVCEALKQSLVQLGTVPDKIRVLRNGVDLKKFCPADRDAARRRVGFSGTTLLSVGNLIPLKGHEIGINALAILDDVHLAIVGEGPEEANLRSLAIRIGVAERVSFLGRLPHDALPDIYRAADLLLLLSSREGWANVLLEAMACGTPVVASNVGGTPEVVANSVAGELLAERTPAAVAGAIKRVLHRGLDRRAVRKYAEGFSWEATSAGQLQFFTEILDAVHRAN
jgi:teichuronic acid biosynthesis glycosyltransferase TuaC